MPSVTYEITINDKLMEDRSLYAHIEQIVIEDNYIQADSFKLKLFTTRDSHGSWRYPGNEMVQVFDKILISAGFDGGPREQLIEGYVTDIDLHIDELEGRSYFEVSGMDSTLLMNLSERLVVWREKSDSQIAREIFSQYGFEPIVEETSNPQREEGYVVIQRETDIEFLKKLADRNGFECFVRKDFQNVRISGYFRNPKPEKTPQRVLSAQFGAETNLISVDFSIDGLRPMRVELRQKDATSGRVQQVKIEDSKQERIGRQSLLDLAKSKISRLTPNNMVPTLVLTDKPSSQQQTMEASAQAVFNDGSWFVTVKGKVESAAYGTILKAKAPVLIKGVGDDFSGEYYVTKVIHRFTPQSYTQEFEGKRNGLGIVGDENFE